MRHSKSRLVESHSEDPDISGDVRRVGTGAVGKPHLPGGESVYLFGSRKKKVQNAKRNRRGGVSPPVVRVGKPNPYKNSVSLY